MEFVTFTLVHENRKVAIRPCDIDKFYESEIEVDGKEVPCVKIDLKNNDWMKVKESFKSVLINVKRFKEEF